MRRLIRTLSEYVRGIDRSEAGATLVFVAVILVALLALSAFAIDFGRMYEERRQLQNGADAAALAIAEDCARGLCDGAYDEYAIAETYVDANARDGVANAWLVDLDLTAQTVTVHNRTEDPGGDNKFDMLFAGAVGFDGFTVGAEATVAWGIAGGFATIPLIISDCEWEKYGLPAGPLDDDPPIYATNPNYTTLFFHAGGNPAEPCNNQAGQDIPGGFGWLKTTDGDDCDVTVYADWVPSDQGNGGPPDGCKDMLDSLLLDLPDNGRTVFIPYFDDYWTGAASEDKCGDQNPQCFHISGYGAFHVVGYKLSSGSGLTEVIFDPPVDPPLNNGGQPLPPNKWNQKFDCDLSTPNNTNEVCLLGYFVDTVYTGPADIGGDDRGVKVIKFTS